MQLADEIRESGNQHAAIRTYLEPKPAGDSRGKVFSPTYEEPRNSFIYATEEQKFGLGMMKECAILGSVQSQANRIEEAL